MTQKRLTYASLFVAIVALSMAALALFEAGDVDVQQMALTGSGYTDLTTLNLSDDLIVADDATIGDDASVGGDLTMSGKVDLNGQQLVLDADGNSHITADTDDQIDVALGGTDEFIYKMFAATVTTDTTTTLFEILDTTPVMTGGTNIQSALNIDLGIGNSTGGTNSVYGILIDAIIQDAQNTETAIVVKDGWDRGIDLDGNSLYLDNDQDSYFSELADDSIGFTPGAATGSLEVRSGNLQVGDGSPGETHDGEDFYVEGISEFDGAAYFDGAVDMDSTLDVSSTFVYGADDLTPLAFDGATQYEVYFGNASSVTQTTVTSATHSMTTAVDWAICYVSDPDDDGGDPFLCVPTISGSSVTFQAIQDDGDNATTAATKIYYLIIGR